MKPFASNELEIHKSVWKLIEAYRMPGVLVWHCPNGEKRPKRVAAQLRAMGVVPGVPDFTCLAKNFLFFLELKATGGRLSDAQQDFISTADAQSFPTFIAWSIIEAAEILQLYGVLRPGIRFTNSSMSVSSHSHVQGGVGAQGRTAQDRAVRSTSEKQVQCVAASA